jgi:hypothetical protein
MAFGEVDRMLQQLQEGMRWAPPQPLSNLEHQKALDFGKGKLEEKGHDTQALRENPQAYMGAFESLLFYITEMRMYDAKQRSRDERDELTSVLSTRTGEQAEAERRASMARKVADSVAQLFGGGIIDPKYVMIEMEKKI